MADKEIKQKKTKKEKVQKTFPARKLPGLFKKSYAPAKFESRILSRLYIQKDRDDVEKLFKSGSDPKHPDRLAVPAESTFTKAQLARFKAMAKDIKANGKFRFALAPFAAVGIFLAALVIVISIFKNPLAKRGLIAACEGVFGARTEIESVDLRFLDATLTVRSLKVGNKNSVYRNLFEADKIELSFNLTQLLRGKFVCRNIECSGMNFDTERQTSCELPVKVKAESEESAFAKELKARSAKALEDLKAQAFDLAGGSDADSIVNNFTSRLKTPVLAGQAKEKASAMTRKWQSKPGELKAQVDSFSESVKALQNLSVNSLGSDPVKIKDALEKIRKASEEGKSIKQSLETVKNDLNVDFNEINGLSSQLASAVAADKKLVSDRIGDIASVAGNPSALISGAVTTVGYDMLGSYYPYVEQIMNYALEAKRTASVQNKAEKNPPEERTSKRERMEGVTFWYASDYPGFLIERIHASGPSFEGTVTELSSNQDVRNIPARAEVKFTSGKISHSGNITIDARSSSNADLVTASYTGSGFSADIDGSRISSAAGIPSIKGNASVTAVLTGDAEGFTVSGKASVNPAELTSDGFENEMLSRYYITALSAIKDVSLGFKAGYKSSEGMSLDISGNLEQQFTRAFKAAVSAAADDVKKEAVRRLNEKINGADSETAEKIKEFTGIKGNIDAQNASLESIQKSLEAKTKELEDKLKAQAGEKASKAAEDALKKAGVDSSAAGSAASKLKKIF